MLRNHHHNLKPSIAVLGKGVAFRADEKVPSTFAIDKVASSPLYFHNQIKAFFEFGTPLLNCGSEKPLYLE
jgi:hypothetical protein